MFRKKKTYIILTLIILIIVGIFYFNSGEPKVEYTTAAAEKGNLARTVSATGNLVSPEEADLSFKISGQVESLLVNVGDRVEKGQKIAMIDRGTLTDDLKQAREEVAVQKNTLYNMKRNNSAYTLEQKEAQRAAIKKSEAAAAEVLRQIGYATLYSPISGMVIKKNVEVGEMTIANAVTANTSVVTIAREGDLEISANIPESDIAKIEIGQKVEATLDAFEISDVFLAEVFEIEPSSTVIQDVVYYKIKLKFSQVDARMKNGMSVDIEIKTAEKNNTVIVPIRAIKEDNGQKYVEILKSDNTLERKNVTIGMSGDDGMVEIASGLSGGERVVTLKKET